MKLRLDAGHIFFLVIALLTSSCSDSTGPSPHPDYISLRVNPPATILSVDSTFHLVAELCSADGCSSRPEFEYSSTDPTVATIDSLGNVTGISIGTATIVVKSRNLVFRSPVSITAAGTFLASQRLGQSDSPPYSVLIRGDIIYLGLAGDGALHVGSVSGHTVNNLPFAYRTSCDLSISASGDTIWTTSYGLAALALPAGNYLKSSPPLANGLCRFGRTRDGNAFLAGTTEGRILNFNYNLDMPGTWETGMGNTILDVVNSVVASPTLDRAYATINGYILELELRNDSIVAQTVLIEPPSLFVRDEAQLAISPDGTTLYAAQRFEKVLHIVRLADRHDEVVPLPGSAPGLAVSPDGKYLMVPIGSDFDVGGAIYGLYLYDLSTRSWAKHWKFPTNGPVDAAMAADGTIVVADRYFPGVYFLR